MAEILQETNPKATAFGFVSIDAEENFRLVDLLVDHPFDLVEDAAVHAEELPDRRIQLVGIAVARETDLHHGCETVGQDDAVQDVFVGPGVRKVVMVVFYGVADGAFKLPGLRYHAAGLHVVDADDAALGQIQGDALAVGHADG